jgi:hypothetical protein
MPGQFFPTLGNTPFPSGLAFGLIALVLIVLTRGGLALPRTSPFAGDLRAASFRLKPHG